LTAADEVMPDSTDPDAPMQTNRPCSADAMFLKGDGDLRLRQTGHAIYVLDSIPAWDRFAAVWERYTVTPGHH
jgi:hypothetical protein